MFGWRLKKWVKKQFFSLLFCIFFFLISNFNDQKTFQWFLIRKSTFLFFFYLFACLYGLIEVVWWIDREENRWNSQFFPNSLFIVWDKFFLCYISVNNNDDRTTAVLLRIGIVKRKPIWTFSFYFFVSSKNINFGCQLIFFFFWFVILEIVMQILIPVSFCLTTAVVVIFQCRLLVSLISVIKLLHFL